MGGQALKNTVTRRYTREEYLQLEQQVLSTLQADFPNKKMAAIPAYRAKASFGDLDILFENDTKMDLTPYIRERFQPNEIVRNTNVFSFDQQQFQVDLIGTPSEDFDISLHYFAWNDLGNIVGRLYHKMGFKYGHNGLHMIFKENNYEFGELCLSKDIEPILAFADLDPKCFLAGFDTLEDIFRYAASSQFFNKDIYLLDNRNHASRIRDKKRATYNALLKWLENQDQLNAYAWESVREHGGRQRQSLFLQRAYEFFPDFKPKLEVMEAEFERWKTTKEKFNGRLVGEWVGLEHQALGQFMQQLKAQGLAEFGDFNAWIYQTSLADIESWVRSQQVF